MKPFVLIALLMTAGNLLFAQSNSATDYLASTGGIGPFKTGMGVGAIEKLLNTKLKLPKTALKDSNEFDTVKASYKDMSLQLVFFKEYSGYDTSSKVTLYSVQCSYPQLKTKSGVGIGDDKLKIVKTYDQFTLTISPAWTEEGKPNPQKATVFLFDNENPKVLIFHLDNNIITRIEAAYYEGG